MTIVPGVRIIVDDMYSCIENNDRRIVYMIRMCNRLLLPVQRDIIKNLLLERINNA